MGFNSAFKGLKAYINSYPYFTHFLTDVSDEECYRRFPRNAIE